MDDILANAAILAPLMIALGGLAGFLAGLLGIGGGIVLVPGLYFSLRLLGYTPDHIMHIAVGTSLATIIPMGLSSAYAHYRKGAVRFDLVRHIGPGIVVGVMAGTAIAARMSGDALMLFFACALAALAVLMQVPPGQRDDGAHTLGQPLGSLGGLVVGAVSALMGIGGATLNVPFMTLNGVKIHNAVASSSVMGILIAIPGMIGFMAIGQGLSGLPPFSIGYVNLLALAAIAPAGILTAPLGAKLAHAVSVKALRRIFSAFLVIVAAKMLWDALRG